MTRRRPTTNELFAAINPYARLCALPSVGCYDTLCPSTSDNTGHLGAFRDIRSAPYRPNVHLCAIVQKRPKLISSTLGTEKGSVVVPSWTIHAGQEKSNDGATAPAALTLSTWSRNPTGQVQKPVTKATRQLRGLAGVRLL